MALPIAAMAALTKLKVIREAIEYYKLIDTAVKISANPDKIPLMVIRKIPGLEEAANLQIMDYKDKLTLDRSNEIVHAFPNSTFIEKIVFVPSSEDEETGTMQVVFKPRIYYVQRDRMLKTYLPPMNTRIYPLISKAEFNQFATVESPGTYWHAVYENAGADITRQIRHITGLPSVKIPDVARLVQKGTKMLSGGLSNVTDLQGYTKSAAKMGFRESKNLINQKERHKFHVYRTKGKKYG